jgi:hypothetical protein
VVEALEDYVNLAKRVKKCAQDKKDYVGDFGKEEQEAAYKKDIENKFPKFLQTRSLDIEVLCKRKECWPKKNSSSCGLNTSRNLKSWEALQRD